jgi:nanoRNase/pAp phosphatase (c-di-AMP/oligoRNAs hydrolase)
MTAFVESCVQTAAGSAAQVQRHARGKPRARRLLKLLETRKNILVTTHMHPDPDAMASTLALCILLRKRLRDAQVSMSIKGQIGGGLNQAFTSHVQLDLVPWDESALKKYDAIILLDVQPGFAYSPLPANVPPTAVIDHHSAPGRRPKCPFCDIRPEVGATSSIIFSYFMELEEQITPDLGAALLFAIESDLAGAAGMPGHLDNLALSSLTLLADTHKLYQMRYVDLPQSYYHSYAAALNNAWYYDTAMIAHLGPIDSLEKPAVMADFLLRFDKVKWSMVSAVHDDRLIISLRTNGPRVSAGEMMRRLVRDIGEGGGHRTKAGGFIRLENGTAAEVDRLRTTLKRRLLRSLKIRMSRGQRLVPKSERGETMK